MVTAVAGWVSILIDIYPAFVGCTPSDTDKTLPRISFLFIFLDFTLYSTFKKDFKELDYAVSSDPVAGIANRFSCDAVIEKYGRQCDVIDLVLWIAIRVQTLHDMWEREKKDGGN